jgi:amino acid permease
MSMPKYIYPVATLSGAIIGVGFLSLPYVAVKVGVLTMLVYLVVITALVFLIHWLFAEVSLVTPDFSRLPAFARIHLGKMGELAALISMVVGSVGVLLAYIVIGGQFLGDIFQPFLGGGVSLYTVIYFVLASVFLFWDIELISKMQFWAILLLFASVIALFIHGLPFLNFSNIFSGPVLSGDLFLPYGVLLFALWGATMIPEAEEMLGTDKKQFKKVIFWGTIIPAIFYLVFIILVVLISGKNTSSDAITGLKNIIGSGSADILFFAGFLATFSSFAAMGLTLKKTFWYDLKIPKNLSWLLTIFFPFLLYYLGFNNFISIIGFIGGILLAIDGILILLMYRKVKGEKSSILVYPLILVFLAGIIYQIIYSLK